VDFKKELDLRKKIIEVKDSSLKRNFYGDVAFSELSVVLDDRDLIINPENHKISRITIFYTTKNILGI